MHRLPDIDGTLFCRSFETEILDKEVLKKVVFKKRLIYFKRRFLAVIKVDFLEFDIPLDRTFGHKSTVSWYFGFSIEQREKLHS